MVFNMEETLTVHTNYAAAVKRRLPLSLVVGLTLLLIAVALALGLPAVYKSKAIILIEQQEIPQDLVRSLVTSFADQRIQMISQRVLTNANLGQIIKRYDLYSKEQKSEPLESVLDDMRKDITIAPISADVVDPKSGKATQATIAFELSYQNKSANLAQQVANELLTLFLNENLKQRSDTANETTTFLAAESEKLGTRVAELEAKLASFKERNSGQLPELNDLNLQLMNRTEQDLAQVENQIRSLEQQRVYLEAELAQQDPTSKLFSATGERILGPADRLKVLESEFTPLAARYGPNHPDVVSKRKEIESLRAQVGKGGSQSESLLKLKQLQTELATDQQKYSPDYPDIKRLKREIELLQSTLAQANIAPVAAVPSLPDAVPDNPVYVQLKAKVDAANADLRSWTEQRAKLKAKLADYEQRLTKAPQVEREYKLLSRDYDNELAKYREVLAKKQEAELAKNLESDQKGERFTLIEPPVIPEEPDKPNRLAIGLVGLIFSIAGGVGAGALAENLDQRVYGRTGITRLLGVPPLAAIPNIETAGSRRKRTTQRLMALSGFIVLLIIAALGIHFFYSPLDVLFYRALRVLGF